jgi:hypothetical protein
MMENGRRGAHNRIEMFVREESGDVACSRLGACEGVVA